MSVFEWADHHWIVSGWCLLCLVGGAVHVLKGIGLRIAGEFWREDEE